MPAKVRSKRRKSSLISRILASKSLTALAVMVIFAIGGGAYLLTTKAASITAVGFTQLTNHSGYLIAQDNGTVYKCSAANAGHTCPVLSPAIPGLWSHIVSIDAPPSSTSAYWLLGGDGGVFTKNGAPFYGSPPNTGQNTYTYVSIIGTPSGQGYWVVAKNGAIFPFGDATSTYKIDTTIRRPAFTTALGGIVGLSSTGIVSADWGGYGATATSGGFANNYGLYLVDGGNGHVYGIGGGVQSAGNATLSSGETATSIFAHGGHTSYLISTSKGGLDAFVGYHFGGNEFGKTTEPIIGVQGYGDTSGKTHYWLLGRYGGVFSFAEPGATATPFFGSAYNAAPSPPTVSSFSANPTSIAAGGSSTLTWAQSGAASCTINGGAVSGSSLVVRPASLPAGYTLVCSNAGGSSAPRSVTISLSGGGGGSCPVSGGTAAGCAVQTALNNAGAHITVDGIIGNQTKGACGTNAATNAACNYVHLTGCPYPARVGSTPNTNYPSCLGGSCPITGQVGYPDCHNPGWTKCWDGTWAPHPAECPPIPPGHQVDYCSTVIPLFTMAASVEHDLQIQYNNKKVFDPFFDLSHLYQNSLNAMSTKLVNMASDGHFNLLQGGGCTSAVTQSDYNDFNINLQQFEIGARYVLDGLGL